MVTFATVEPHKNPGGCAANELYGINAGDNSKMHLAMLPAARTSGTRISFYIPDPPNGANACDAYGRPRATHVMVGDMWGPSPGCLAL